MKKLLLSVAALVLTFAIVEGLASGALLIEKLVTTLRSPVAERVHSRYDPELGWVAVPNLYVPDLYGPGVYFRSDSRGFRDNAEVAPGSPPDRLRVVCSGDSFTLGYGVDNDHAWCTLIGVLDRRFQTVNMGQGGYGIDQAYLWYRRDGRLLEHQVHLFAFTTTDFDRMQHHTFLGYGKPVLKIRDGRLVTENVPVPRRPFYVAWLARNLPLFRELRGVQLANAIMESFLHAGGAAATSFNEAGRAIASKVFENLEELNREKGSVLILVYLPMEADYAGNELTDSWRDFVRTEAAKRGVEFVDLVADFQKMPRSQMKKVFLPAGELSFRGAGGHYSAEGNKVIAEALYKRLAACPEISTRLVSLRPPM